MNSTLNKNKFLHWSHGDDGKSFVELLLWMPVFFFFLFAVTDLALYLRDRAIVSDTLRGSLNNEFLNRTSGMLFSRDEQNNLDLLDEESQILIDKLATDLSNSLAQKLLLGPLNDNKIPYYVEFALIELDIDTSTGAAISYQMSRRRLIRSGNFSLKEKVKPAENIISEALASRDAPSQYSFPAGIGYSALTGQGAEVGHASINYLNKSVIFFARVVMLPRSIGSNFTEMLLGDLRLVEQREFRIARSPLV